MSTEQEIPNGTLDARDPCPLPPSAPLRLGARPWPPDAHSPGSVQAQPLPFRCLRVPDVLLQPREAAASKVGGRLMGFWVLLVPRRLARRGSRR